MAFGHILSVTTMKHLLLLRHAKSDWDDPQLADIDRPLSARGERDAPRIGEALRKRKPQPEIILSSTARRTRETIAAVVEAANLSIEPQFTSSLYAASASDILKIVRGLPDDAASALLVGHNPGFEELASYLTGTWQAMPTGGLACIALDVPAWTNAKDDGRLEWFLSPKTLDDDK